MDASGHGGSRAHGSRTNFPAGFFGVTALLFAASATLTIVGCASMASMGELPMPGGWTLSMAWMPMCGRTWPDVATAFLGMSSEEHTSELQSLMRISYAVFCLKKKNNNLTQ